MSYENRRKIKPLTEERKESLEAKKRKLIEKKEKAVTYNDTITANKYEEEIKKIDSKLGIKAGCI